MSDRWQQIEHLFHSALEREESQRAAFLKEACAGNDALRQEVESLLAQEKGADSLLEAPALEVAAKMLSEGPGHSLLGRRIGSYQILSLLGAGGMGEVYEANDTKLGRNVAIKVLPSAFVDDAERLARFRREARMLAALNHPNIATIHGQEQADGVQYLVMELVPGETLAERLSAGPLGIEESLKIGGQIAEALEAAHEKGVIHRDLKPANVKMTPEGRVKVLDFGLAKAFAGDGGLDLSRAPTLSEEGKILGTPAYMSPEQARGKAVDKRTDIWAVGCVLYELLTAKQAFRGETLSDTIAAVLEREPDWQALPASTPAKIRDLLRRSLQKDPQRRLRDIGDARIEIEEALAAPKDAGATQSVASPKTKAPWAVAGTLVIVAVVALWVAWRATRPVEQKLRPLVRLDVDLGPDVSLGSAYGTDAIISPDGARLVYVSQGRLFSRRVDQPNATELTGTEGAFAPFLSPDGHWVAFFAQGKLNKISVDGGAMINLCDAPNPRGGSWGDDGGIIAALNNEVALSRIPSAGGAPEPVTELDRERGEDTQRWPQVLPGGKAVVFTTNPMMAGLNFDAANIDVMSFKDHRRKTLVRGGAFGRYLPSGHLIYVNRGRLFAIPFDVDRLEVRGTPAQVLDQVGYNPATGSAQLDFSQTGTMVYRTAGAGSGPVTVQWLDAAGKTQPLLAKAGAGPFRYPSLSPDGQRLAFARGIGSNWDIWVYQWQRDTMTRLTFGPADSTSPIWSPDGRYILFRSAGGMFWTRSDGSGRPQQLTQSKNTQWPWSFTPNGKRLAFQVLSPETSNDLWTVPVESDEGGGLRAGKPQPYLQTPFDEQQPFFSPDGRWLAYSSNESGNYQVYVRAFPDKGGKWQISNSGGMYPMWSRNGRELFFRTGANQIMVASYTVKGDSFVADKPRVWSEKRLPNLGLVRTYDLAPDGKRIAAIMPVEGSEEQKAQNHVIFLENFFDELRRKVSLSGK